MEANSKDEVKILDMFKNFESIKVFIYKYIVKPEFFDEYMKEFIEHTLDIKVTKDLLQDMIKARDDSSAKNPIIIIF